VAFTIFTSGFYNAMQCNSEKFQPGQIEFLTENREGIKATLECYKPCYCILISTNFTVNWFKCI